MKKKIYHFKEKKEKLIMKFEDLRILVVYFPTILHKYFKYFLEEQGIYTDEIKENIKQKLDEFMKRKEK